MRRLYFALARGFFPMLVYVLVLQRAFEHVFVDQHIALDILVVKTARQYCRVLRDEIETESGAIRVVIRKPPLFRIVKLNKISAYHSTMRSLHGVGSILSSKGRAKLLMATMAWPGARLGSRIQSESSTTPSERFRRLMTLASLILCRM